MWVHALRRNGDSDKKQIVTQLLINGEAAWCSVVRLELWNGVGSDNERQPLREFEAAIPNYAVTDEVWERAFELASLCRKAGKTAPATDVLIAACARHHGVGIEHADAHFEFLMALAGA
ncbi:MAG TPA: PIN domain-containing protein [Chthoniobacterales bacterium]